MKTCSLAFVWITKALSRAMIEGNYYLNRFSTVFGSKFINIYSNDICIKVYGEWDDIGADIYCNFSFFFFLFLTAMSLVLWHIHFSVNLFS